MHFVAGNGAAYDGLNHQLIKQRAVGDRRVPWKAPPLIQLHRAAQSWPNAFSSEKPN